MRIVVTGASGFVGVRLVPQLVASGARLLLVGREPARLARQFPALEVCGYEELVGRAAGFDLLVHLAVINTNAKASEETVRDVNVRLLLQTLEAAKLAGIDSFLNVSSVKALDPRNHSAYARSKREAAKYLAATEGIGTLTLYLPAVHGDGWCGKLAFLDRLPVKLASALFPALSALQPTVHVSRIAAFVLERAHIGHDAEAILSDGQDSSIVYRFVRRMTDLTFATVVMIFFGWGLVLIWTMVRIQSRGPGIFAQERVGRDGKIFTCYKFRTMRLGTVEAPTNEISPEDVTLLGRLLRRTKLDELPQIWNIFRNEISLIGPRPCLPVQSELVEARRRRGVLRLKPGMSGLAQVNGIDMSEPEVLARWDARYLGLQSLLLDLRIALATVGDKGSGDRVASCGGILSEVSNRSPHPSSTP